MCLGFGTTFWGGEDLLSEKASHCTSYPLHRSMPGISLPWNWHAVLCVGTTPPRQVAPTPSARVTQWASDSRSKSRSQPGNAPTRRMKEVRRGHSKIPARLGKIKQCRNQRNLRAEKRKYTPPEFSRQWPQIQKQESYATWVTQSPIFF